MRICVIGAGIVGCATAYHLTRQGHDVLVIDGAPEVGLGTSFANGAQLSYSYVEPFASPSTLRAIPSMLLSRASPIRFRPRLDVAQWAWIAQFLKACTAERVQRGTKALLDLAQLSRATLEQWMEEERWAFSFRRNGKLVLCATHASLAHQQRQVKLQASWGCRQQVLGREACIQKEPALAHSADAFVGGVWTQDECVGDPFLLCREMKASIERRGGRFQFGAAVRRLVVKGTQVVAAATDEDLISADAFVVANGVQSVRLSKTVGLRLPVYPLKGYSLTLPLRKGAHAPVASVTSLGRKTVFAPLNGKLRVAAMVEIGSSDQEVPRERIEAMVEAVEAVYPGLCDFDDPQPWTGLRPATPTSRPIVGRAHLHNLFLNVGHGALGLTLAAGAAAVVGQEIGSGATLQ